MTIHLRDWMKLLSPKEIKGATLKAKESLIRENLLIEKAIAHKRQELNNIVLSNTEEPLTSLESHDLRNEIALLKNRITYIESENSAMNLELSFFKTLVQEKETIAKSAEEEKQRVVQEYVEKKNKEDELIASLEEKIDYLQSAEQDIIAKEDSIRRRMEVLIGNEQSFLSKQGELFQLIADKEKRLQEEKNTVSAMRQSAELLMEEVEKEKAKLEQEKKHIESRQQALRFAFDQARLKGII